MNMPYQQPMMNYTPNYGAYQCNPRADYNVCPYFVKER